MVDVNRWGVALLGTLFVGACGGNDGDTSAAATAGASDSVSATTGSGGSATGSGGAASTGGSGGSATGGSAPTELVHLDGRFDETDPQAPAFTWSGTSIGTRVSGSSISVQLDGSAGVFFQILVDGASNGQFTTASGYATYSLTTGLAKGEHDVTIYRRTEGFTGVVAFRGFAPGQGAMQLPSPSPFQHRIEFVGDSITCGYGVEGADANCNFTPDTESAYLTYAAIAARNTSSSAHLIAYSGKGVVQNYGGDTNEPMPVLYLRTLTDDASKPWDFTQWIADAVVINLGSNDFSAPIDHDVFVGGYVSLLGTVRSHYPAARIFTVGWTDWGADKEQWVKDALTTSGDTNTHFVEFTQDPADGFGCNGHPSQTTHAKLGQLLTDVLKQDLGW